MTQHATAPAPGNHVVSFYDHDAEVVAEVARYVAEGLAQGERVIIVATAEHRAAIDEVLVQHGTDAVRARVLGRYLTLDAAETLALFMVDGAPDPARFEAVIGPVIDAAGEDGCAVRVFGEMVSLLWNDGNVAAAVQLEARWNDLARSRRFFLLCAYPHGAIQQSGLNDVNELCTLHSKVTVPRSYSAGKVAGRPGGARHVSDVLLPVSAAVPAVRRFVTGVLKSWGEDDLVADATVMASELATNAVSHCASPFRVSVTRSGDVLRIAIEDVSPAVPRVVEAEPEAFGGRGIAIVEELSASWGCEETPNGKRVWAEMRTAEPATR